MSGVLIAAAVGVSETPPAILAVRFVELVTVASVTFVLARRWWAGRAASTGWALALFATLTVVLVSGYRPGSPAVLIHLKVVISLVLVIPYLLVMLSRSMGALGRRGFCVASGFMAAELLATAVTPALSLPGEDRAAWEVAYVALAVVGWCVQSALAAESLWRAGQGQPAAVRSRMRSLSLGAVVLALAVVVSASSTEKGTGVVVTSAAVGLVGICLLATAFLMPAPLRLLWRQADLATLAAAERGLMTAVGITEVAETILPALAATFGGGGAALLDRDGKPVSDRGMGSAELIRLECRLGEVDEGSDDTTLVAAMTSGWLVVRGGRFAPVFGRDELSLLERVATLVDLALQRAALFEEEQRSRREAEGLNKELHTLLYSVSHDLRSPIISVLGYLDCLDQEHRAELSEPGRHYVDRITVNALYMQNLISDLLELSRIGRVDNAAQPVDLRALAESVADGMRFAHPQVSVEVAEDLPVVRMNDVRARQLLTNLVDNAVKHAGRDDARVRLLSRPEPDGRVSLLVSDNGRGIAESYRSKAFDVFERLDAARNGTPGTGMGLPICKRVAESIGGTIAIDGPQEGDSTGTTLRLSFPASVVQPRTTPVSVKENA